MGHGGAEMMRVQWIVLAPPTLALEYALVKSVVKGQARFRFSYNLHRANP
jgi:hypothetical protein